MRSFDDPIYSLINRHLRGEQLTSAELALVEADELTATFKDFTQKYPDPLGNFFLLRCKAAEWKAAELVNQDHDTMHWHLLEFKAAASADSAKIISYVGEGWEEGQYLEITLSKNDESQWQVDVRISNDALVNVLLNKNIYLGYVKGERSYIIATLSPEEDQLYYHALCEWNEVGVNPDEAIAGNVFVCIEPKGRV